MSLLIGGCTVYPKISKLSEANQMTTRGKTFAAISFFTALFWGFLTMAIEPRATVIIAILAFIATFFTLCIGTSTSEVEL